jgi:hypothetical protein
MHNYSYTFNKCKNKIHTLENFMSHVEFYYYVCLMYEHALSKKASIGNHQFDANFF